QTNDGTRAVKGVCNGTASQQWALVPNGDGSYLLRNQAALGKCLQVTNGQTAIYACAATNAQQHWRLVNSLAPVAINTILGPTALAGLPHSVDLKPWISALPGPVCTPTTLTNGMSLTSGCLLTGTPISAGNFGWTVTVSAGAGGAQSSIPVGLVVTAP